MLNWHRKHKKQFLLQYYHLLLVSLKLFFSSFGYKVVFNAIFLSTTGAEIFRQGRQRRERQSDKGRVVQCSQLFWSAHN